MECLSTLRFSIPRIWTGNIVTDFSRFHINIYKELRVGIHRLFFLISSEMNLFDVLKIPVRAMEFFSRVIDLEFSTRRYFLDSLIRNLNSTIGH